MTCCCVIRSAKVLSTMTGLVEAEIMDQKNKMFTFYFCSAVEISKQQRQSSTDGQNDGVEDRLRKQQIVVSEKILTVKSRFANMLEKGTYGKNANRHYALLARLLVYQIGMVILLILL